MRWEPKVCLTRHSGQIGQAAATGRTATALRGPLLESPITATILQLTIIGCFIGMVPTLKSRHGKSVRLIEEWPNV